MISSEGGQGSVVIKFTQIHVYIYHYLQNWLIVGAYEISSHDSGTDLLEVPIP